MTDQRGRRLGHGLIVVAGIVSLLVVVVLAAPQVRRVTLGEDPRPLLESLQREPAVTLAPDALVFEGQLEKAASGTVAVRRHYSFAGRAEPEMTLAHYRQVLPSLGWSPANPPPTVAGRELYLKTVAGKQATYVVAADAEGAFTDAWMYYDTGLIGG